MNKKILMVAGPNGAGKTTMTLELLDSYPALYEFVNADEIAKGLAPKHPEKVALLASKLMIQRIKELLSDKKNFAFETTGAGLNYLNHLKAAKAHGYEIHLTFLWLASAEHAIKRVAQRVKQGGHHVAEDVITRRYYSGIKNLLTHYLNLADKALIIDNSFEELSFKKIIARKNNKSIDIMDETVWKTMEKIQDER